MATGSSSHGTKCTRIHLLLLDIQHDVQADDKESSRLLSLLQVEEILRHAQPCCENDASLMGNTTPSSSTVHRQITKFLQSKDKYTSLASMLLKSRAFHEVRRNNNGVRCHDNIPDDEQPFLPLVDLPRTCHNQPYIPSSPSQSSGTAPTQPIIHHPLSISHQFPMVGMAQILTSNGDNDNDDNHIARAVPSDLSLSIGMDIVMFDALNTKLYDTEEEFLDVFQDQFVEHEWQQLMECSNHCKLQEFYIQWAIKEAYTKARGLGMGIPFHNFWVDMEQNEWNDGCHSLWECILAKARANLRPGAASTPPSPKCCFKATIKHVTDLGHGINDKNDELYLFYFLPLSAGNIDHSSGMVSGCTCICVGPFDHQEHWRQWWQQEQVEGRVINVKSMMKIRWTSIEELMDWHRQPTWESERKE